MPLQGRCRAIANKMPNGTKNVIGHMTTDIGPVRATRKKRDSDLWWEKCAKLEQAMKVIADNSSL